MTEKVQLVTLKQKGRYDSNNNYFHRRLKKRPVEIELITAFDLLNKFLKVKGFVYSKNNSMSGISQIKSPTYYLYYCFIDQKVETGVTITPSNIFVQPEHVITILGPEVITDKIADYLTSKIRTLFLESLKDKNKRTYNTLEEFGQTHTKFQYKNPNKRIQILAKPLLEYFDFSGLEEKVKEQTVPAAKFLNKMKISV